MDLYGSFSFNKLLKEPVEGFICELIDDSSMFAWKVYLEGPKDTAYEGGIFQLQFNFPSDFPMSPPTLKFISDFWHPNVYMNGNVCISILHPPGEDPMSGELPEERWLPTQSVSTILLSVISMLGDPNTSSPANVDASIQWARDQEGYKKKCKTLVAKSLKEVPPHIQIPHPESDPEERKKYKQVEEDVFDIFSGSTGIDDEDICVDEDDEENEEENEDRERERERESENETEDDLEKPVTDVVEKKT